jgi:hypothetical protein
MNKFLAINAISYNSLDWSGESESETDLGHKRTWLRNGKATLTAIAKKLGATPHITTNKSGSIDRGFVSGFMEKNGRVAYIQLSDGMQDILYRTATDLKDYRGGSNNTAKLNATGFERLTAWLADYLQ